jgi:hypothetical protein
MKINDHLKNENTNSETQAPSLDPFDPERLRLQNPLGADVSVKKALTHIPVTKPPRGAFFRVHPSENYRVDTAVIEIDSEIYLLDISLRDSLAFESTVSNRKLVTSITTSGTLFVWPMKISAGNGGSNGWYESAFAAARLAEERWLRISSNMAAQCYEAFVAEGDLNEPNWPDISFRDILQRAFQNRLIDSPDHTVLRRLRGEIS